MNNSKQYSPVKARANDAQDPKTTLRQVEYLLASVVKRIRAKKRAAEQTNRKPTCSRACNGGA
ncbi:hypothetical protein SDC9_137805 [bioreactor metagenome]|uniref:Uncharacterized protein n=1 Tax=bioreactor metagenome TaxID=1076179 RepID=A0A645DPH9_9ZZZZ